MNHWDEIWKNKGEIKIGATEDVFHTFSELKRADGFDTQDVDGYYEAFWEQWQKMAETIKKHCGSKIESVYEVGCGSGVNLYMFEKLKNVKRAGGVDYSQKLVDIASGVTHSDDLTCGEAVNIAESPKYDVVMSDSVFQYFQDADYGMKVLEKMWAKAEKMVVITEVHDLAKKEEHLAHRRACVENYDEKYAGLDKTFYSRQMFTDFAQKCGGRCIIVEPDNELYWNNKYVFDVYICK